MKKLTQITSVPTTEIVSFKNKTLIDVFEYMNYWWLLFYIFYKQCSIFTLLIAIAGILGAQPMAGKIVKGLGGNTNSQSVRDRLNAAKHSISGSGLAKSICKATTDQVISPKAKHLNCKYFLYLWNNLLFFWFI